MSKYFCTTRQSVLIKSSLFILLALFSTLIAVSINSKSVYAAGECTSAQLSGNKSSFTTTVGVGNIEELRTGVYTVPGDARTSAKCEQYNGSNNSFVYKRDSSSSNTYTVQVPCGDKVVLTGTPSNTTQSVSGKYQERVGQGTGRSATCSDGSSRSISISVKDSQNACSEKYYIFATSNVINGQVCVDGSLVTTNFTKSADDPKIYGLYSGGTGVRGTTCGASYNGRITLSKEVNGVGAIVGTIQKLTTGANGRCVNDGSPRKIDVEVRADDTSGLGDYTAIASSYADKKCEGRKNLGADAYSDCRAQALTDFRGFVAECTAASTDANAILDCLAEKAPEIADELNALKEQIESGPTCKIDAIGWIVCPVMTFMAGIVDAAYGFVASLLNVQPLGFSDTENGIYGAWAIMRNIANVAFIIAFLIIIFSQITSVGITNYGVKKMLPRLVIAAILVNASYIICALAVDASNIVGASLVQMFESVQGRVAGPPGPDLPGFDSDFTSGGSGWTSLVGPVIAGSILVAGGMYVGLSALLPALLAALLAIVTVFLVLTLRQALIILLIVISPLAFVAYLLPNTEKLFDSWRKLLLTLLLMFPIISGIFGASALASTVVMSSADGPYKIVIQIMGALIAIIPLALTPVVMKTAGGVLNRFGGFVNNPNKGPFDKLRKRAEGYRENRQNIRAMRAAGGRPVFGGGQFRRAAKRNAISNSLKSERGRAEQQYIADSMVRKDGSTSMFGQRMAGGDLAFSPDPAALQRALAGAQFTIEKAELEEVKAEQALIGNFDVTALKDVLKDQNASSARKAAALDRIIKVGQPTDYEDFVNQYGNDKDEKNSVIRSTMAQSLASNGPKWVKASDLDAIQTGNLGGRKLSDIASKNIEDGVLSQEKMVEESSDNLKYAFKSSSATGRSRMKQTATDLSSNDILKGKIKHNATSIRRLSIGLPPNTTP